MAVLVDSHTRGEALTLIAALRVNPAVKVVGPELRIPAGMVGSYRMPHSGFRIRFDWGRVYHGNGSRLPERVRPDIEVADTPGSLSGGEDPHLEAALGLLEKN